MVVHYLSADENVGYIEAIDDIMVKSKTLDEFFSGYERSRQIFDKLFAAIDKLGLVEMHVSKSQIAFLRIKAFAWAWVPDRYLRGKHTPLVLSLTFAKRNDSSRWKQIVEPSPGRWMHHLGLYSVGDIDDEVKRWLREAWEAAS